MSSLFDSFSGINQRASVVSIDTDKSGAGQFIKAVVEKNISPFKFDLVTEFGKAVVSSEKIFSKGDIVNFKIAESNGRFFIEPEKEGSFLRGEFKGFVKIDGSNEKSSGKIFRAIVEKQTALPKFQVSVKSEKIIVESNSFLKPGDEIKLKLSDFKKIINSSKFQKNSVKDTFVKNTALKDTVVKDTVVKDTVVKDTVVKDTVVKDTVLKDTVVKDTVVKDTVVKDTVVKDTFWGNRDSVLSKESLSLKVSDIDFINKSDEFIRTYFSSKKPLKHLIAALQKKSIPALKEFTSSLDKLNLKDFQDIKNKILDNFANPQKITSDSLRKTIKYFLGSSFDKFSDDLNELKEISVLYEKKNISDKNFVTKIIESLEKAEKLFETVENQRNVNLVRFADSSRLFLFIPFSGKDFESAEFFMDKKKENNQSKDKTLRAVVKLNMSKLGLLKADLRLYDLNIIKIFFEVENNMVLDVVEEGFKELEFNLKKSGFKEVFFHISTVEKEVLGQSLIKEFLFDGKTDSNFNIVI